MTPHEFPPSLTGYFDWNTFRSASSVLSAEQLSICSKTGIDADTLKLAQHLCNHYPIPEARRRELAETVKSFMDLALDDDRKTTLPDDVYWLVKLIHELGSSDSGAALLCICNVLGNRHPVESIMTIFAEIVKEAGVPDGLVPSIQAW